MTRDKLSECRHEQSQTLEFSVRKPERKWTLVNRRLIFHEQFLNQFPQFELVDHRAQEPVQVQEQVK